MFCNICGEQVPDTYDYCPNCGSDLREAKAAAAAAAETAAAEAAAQAAAEVAPVEEPVANPEGDTTVLSFDTAEPVMSAEPTMPAFPEEPVAPMFQEPAAPEMPAPVDESAVEKVVTPAPVTGSRILSNENVPPVQPVVPAQDMGFNPVGGFDQPAMNTAPNPYGGPAPSAPMGGYNPEMSEEYKPISPWGYIGYNILFSIPLVGLILIFVMGFSNKNVNVKNYAKSYLILIIISVAISIVIGIISAILGASIFSSLNGY